MRKGRPVSFKAVEWALRSARVGDPIAKVILIALAEYARPDGTAAWPSHAALAECAEVSARTVIRKLQHLEDRDLIRPGDQALVSHYPTNRRPRVWDLNMAPRGDTLSPQDGVRGDSLSPQDEVRGDRLDHLGVTAVSYKPPLEPKEPTGSASAPAPVDNSQRLIAEWIDHSPGGRPPGRVVGQVAKEVSLMLDEGIPYDQVRRGLQTWQSKRLNPSVLASVVHEMRSANGSSQPAKERIICKTCQRSEMACRKMAKQTGDEHEWVPTTVVA